MTRSPSEEVCNAEISDLIVPFGDDDDDDDYFFSFDGDNEIGSGEPFGYEYTQYGSDVEIPEGEFCQMDAGQHSRQFQQGMLHNQDVTDAAGFIANTPDSDTPPPALVLPSQTHDMGAFSYTTPISNTSYRFPPLTMHQRPRRRSVTSKPPHSDCQYLRSLISLPVVSKSHQSLHTATVSLRLFRVRANPVYSQIDNFPSGAADEFPHVSCIWEQEGVLERYKALIGDAKWSKYRHREVGRWGKEVMSLVMLSRPAITLDVVHKLFDGYFL